MTLLDDPVEHVVLVLDVVVEGHRLDAELAADPAHRDGVEALGVHDPQGRLDHALPREALAAVLAAVGSTFVSCARILSIAGSRAPIDARG